jgi:putative spermidine/putrescine transport system ATP-binding protein
MVEFTGVSKSFGQVTAARDVNLTVRDGELLAILGPSGCGKTTLLRIAGGYELPDSGAVWIGGIDMTLAAPERRNVGMVFQNYALFPHMTVLENVEFGLRMRGMGRSERRDRAEAMLELAGIRSEGSRRPAELSGGQQQRVALARALVIEPSVLLLDEPLANLDRNIRIRLRGELRAIQQRLGIATILVTHDQDEAAALAGRIAVMNEGRIEQVGTNDELRASPSNGFVADFLGLAQ